jgi:hypothetical protein
MRPTPGGMDPHPAQPTCRRRHQELTLGQRLKNGDGQMTRLRRHRATQPRPPSSPDPSARCGRSSLHGHSGTARPGRCGRRPPPSGPPADRRPPRCCPPPATWVPCSGGSRRRARSRRPGSGCLGGRGGAPGGLRSVRARAQCTAGQSEARSAQQDAAGQQVASGQHRARSCRTRSGSSSSGWFAASRTPSSEPAWSASKAANIGSRSACSPPVSATNSRVFRSAAREASGDQLACDLPVWRRVGCGSSSRTPTSPPWSGRPGRSPTRRSRRSRYRSSRPGCGSGPSSVVRSWTAATGTATASSSHLWDGRPPWRSTTAG